MSAATAKLAVLLRGHHDISECSNCAHATAGHSTSVRYCRAGESRLFAHQMRQPGAPCGPSAVLFVPMEQQE